MWRCQASACRCLDRLGRTAAEVWPRGGSGVFELRIRKDGGVSGIVITKSTGEPLLDRAAMRALIRYRFKPGVFRRVYEPIDYTVTRYR